VQLETVEMKKTKNDVFPEDWEIDEIGNLFDIQQGKALSKKNRLGNRPRPFLRTANVYWGRLESNHLDRMDFTEEEEEKYRLEVNDLLICEGGDIGRTAIVDRELKGIYHQNHVFRARALNGSVNSKFVMYWMQAAIKLLNLYSGFGNKTTIANLSKSRLSAYKIPLPHLPEQRKIASILSTVQEAIEQTESVIQATRELKKSMMKHLFTYGPVPVSQADQVGLKKTEIGNVPSEWDIVKVNKVFDFSRKPRNLKLQSKQEIPFIPMGSISESWDQVERYVPKKWEEISSGTFVEKNDLIVAKITPSFENGKQALLKNLPIDFGYATTEVWALHPNKNNKVLSEFLFYYLKKKNIRAEIANKMEGSTGRQRVPKSVLANLLIPLPSISIQQKVINYFWALDYKIKQEQDRINGLNRLFNSLLENLMTAKIRVVKKGV